MAGLAVGGLSFGLIRGEAKAWADTAAWVSMAVGVVALVAFPVLMARRANPLVPLGLFRERAFATINLATFFIYGALYVTMSYQVLLLQGVLGYTALGAGIIGLPVGVMLSVLSTRMGTLSARLGARRFMVGGPILMAAGMLWYARLPADSAAWKAAIEAPATLVPPVSALIDVLPAVLIFGLGISMVVAPLTSTLMSSIPARFSGLGLGDQQLRVAGWPAAARGDHLHRHQRHVLRQPRQRRRAGYGRSGGPRRVPAAQPGPGRSDRRAGQRGRGRVRRGLPPGDAGGRGAAAGRRRGVVGRPARRRRGLRRRRREGCGVTRDWDAATYDRVADPMARWGATVLDRLPIEGDERVLDAGCGSGRVTELLAARLPRGRVIALDASPAMIAAARTRLARFADRVEYVVADLGQPLPLGEPVDAILSTATFHWVPDHDALFANLAAVLRPGGRLVAQCGGVGNIASIRRVLATIGDGWLGASHFETPLATTRRLDAAGFVDIECWLTDEPTPFEPGEPLETYLRTVILGAHLERLPAGERDAFVHAVATALPEPLIDYVRLNIVARRASH